MQNTIGGGEWPLVGRAEELDHLVKLRSRGLSAVISGPAGWGSPGWRAQPSPMLLATAGPRCPSGAASGLSAFRSDRCGPCSAFLAHQT